MSYSHRENRIQTTSGGFQGDNVGDHMTKSFGQWHGKCPFTNISSNQGGSRQPYRSKCCTGYTCLGDGEGSHGLCPAEQHGHLPIRDALLLGHAHGLTQVDSQDVLALRDESKTNTDQKNRLKLPETQSSEFLQKIQLYCDTARPFPQCWNGLTFSHILHTAAVEIPLCKATVDILAKNTVQALPFRVQQDCCLLWMTLHKQNGDIFLLLFCLAGVHGHRNCQLGGIITVGNNSELIRNRTPEQLLRSGNVAEYWVWTIPLN